MIDLRSAARNAIRSEFASFDVCAMTVPTEAVNSGGGTCGARCNAISKKKSVQPSAAKILNAMLPPRKEHTLLQKATKVLLYKFSEKTAIENLLDFTIDFH